MLCDVGLKIDMLRRVSHINTTCDHANCSAFQRTMMRMRVNTPCQTRDDGNTLISQIGRQFAREPTCRGRGIARAHHRNAGTAHKRKITLYDQSGGCCVQFCKKCGIVWISPEHISRAQINDTGPFPLNFFWCRKLWCTPDCSRCKGGNGIQRCRCRTKARQQLPITYGPNICRTYQSEPIQLILIGGRHQDLLPIRGSVPASRRRILSRCIRRTVSAKRSIASASCFWPKSAATTGAERAAPIPPTEEIRVTPMPTNQHSV